jgi:hypothetical protein
MSEWVDLLTLAVDHAAILDADAAMSGSTDPVDVIPRAAGDPSTMRGWADFHRMSRTFRSRANGESLDDWFGSDVFTENHIEYGVSWRPGGRHRGRGLYIADATAWCRVHSIGAAQKFVVDARFLGPYYEGPDDNPVAQLFCEIEVTWEQFFMLDSTWKIRFEMNGDGSGKSEYL